MARSIIAGMLVVIVLWVGAVAYASSKLIWANWPLFVSWRRQTRETRTRLALWFAVPLMKAAILLFSAHALWSLAAGHYVSDVAMIRGLITGPLVLTSSILMLWWVTDRQYGPELGDRLWWRLMFAGVALGCATVGLLILLG
jgi:hypothetical protein